MRKIVVAALFLVGCEPAGTLEGPPATPSNPSSRGTEPLALSANRDLSVEISIPSISGLSPTASQMISRELAAVKEQAIRNADICSLIAGEGQRHFEFKPESINTRKHFSSVLFAAESRCGQNYRRWTVLRTFNLATGKQADPFSLISMNGGHWQALVAEHSTSRFRACTDPRGTDVVAFPTPYIAKDGIGVDLPLSPGAPQSCWGEVLVIPNEVVRRASEDRLAHGWLGPAHQDYIFK